MATQQSRITSSISMIIPGNGCIDPEDVDKLEVVEFVAEFQEDFNRLFVGNDKYNGRLIQYVEQLFSILWKNYKSVQNGNNYIEMMKPLQARLFIDLLDWVTSDVKSSLIQNSKTMRLCAFPVELCSKKHQHSHTKFYTHYDYNTLYLMMKVCEAILRTYN
jgi:hypothetical protein